MTPYSPCTSTSTVYVIIPTLCARLTSLTMDVQKIFTLTANAQIWPRSLNDQLGAQPGDIYLVVQDFGSLSSKIGFDFINGYTWLERFYTVYDTANHRVGFATTPFTSATTN